MSITELVHGAASRLADWWRDREDERLDELADQYYRNASDRADRSVVNARQLAGVRSELPGV